MKWGTAAPTSDVCPFVGAAELKNRQAGRWASQPSPALSVICQGLLQLSAWCLCLLHHQSVTLHLFPPPPLLSAPPLSLPSVIVGEERKVEEPRRGGEGRGQKWQACQQAGLRGMTREQHHVLLDSSLGPRLLLSAWLPRGCSPLATAVKVQVDSCSADKPSWAGPTHRWNTSAPSPA